jgi:peptidoglycan/xylan/chitin deacetylase (PgdA/CDA1 family)
MVRNFLFHRVSPERDPLWDPMDPVLFEKCLRYISERFELITIEDIPHTQLSERHATISFDDGYKDNIVHALPILEKYKIKASFYVVTDCVNKQLPVWTYHLDYLFKHTRRKELDMHFGFLPEALRVKELPDAAQRIRYIRKLKPFLKSVTHEQCLQVISHVSAMYHDVTLPELMMSREDLKLLQSLGHTIGSHTVSHPLLATMTDENELRKEIQNSREELFRLLGSYPLTISYPAGSYNAKVVELSRESGYQLGLTVKQDVYDPRRDHLFEIPRIELYNEAWWKTRLRITTSLEQIKKVLRYR